jgi:hypothetical protein
VLAVLFILSTPLAFVHAYYFGMFLSIAILAYLNGVVLLPVLLSLVGPAEPRVAVAALPALGLTANSDLGEMGLAANDCKQGRNSVDLEGAGCSFSGDGSCGVPQLTNGHGFGPSTNNAAGVDFKVEQHSAAAAGGLGCEPDGQAGPTTLNEDGGIGEWDGRGAAAAFNQMGKGGLDGPVRQGLALQGELVEVAGLPLWNGNA